MIRNPVALRFSPWWADYIVPRPFIYIVARPNYICRDPRELRLWNSRIGAHPVRILGSHFNWAEETGVIPRYTRPVMGRIWAEENRFRAWLRVELAATETLAEAGVVPKESAEAIRSKADFKLERIHEIEAEVKHDVIAFTTAVAEFVGPDSRWFHYGLTSNDVVDTAQSLLVKEASDVIRQDLQRLLEVLKRRAWEFK